MISLPKLPRQVVLILVLQFTNSLGASALVPMMSFFIVEGLNSEPWQVGLYTGLLMPLTLAANRWAGERLDHGFLVKRLLLISIFAFITATALLTQISNLMMLILLIAPLMSLSNMGTGTIFTFCRVYSEKNELDVTKINSWLRMTVSLAWMIGPAASFTLVAQFGFSIAFATAFGVGLVYLLLGSVVIPRDFRSIRKPKSNDEDSPINWGLMIAGLICLGFVITNTLFVSAMPLFFVQETGLPGSTPGLSLSVKCLVEIFVIFGSVYLAERIGIRQVLLIASCLAAISMYLFAQVTEVWHVIAISVLEGTYYGLFAGVSISFVQSFAPDRPGRATAVYVNSLFLGGMIGSVSMGFIASATDFKTVLYVAACSSIAALVVVLATLRVQPAAVEERA
ncbi:MAG: MFS transporter [Roseibium sp.]|uniref:MFS transporter n=1 Tax=Roseibium sp. TaxID=1936156 RepID=UPI0026233AD9|nr:MFS transporter [Roseibium sp.]MCV0425658.1 MFS transporter [Roseibium sp.]